MLFGKRRLSLSPRKGNHLDGNIQYCYYHIHLFRCFGHQFQLVVEARQVEDNHLHSLPNCLIYDFMIIHRSAAMFTILPDRDITKIAETKIVFSDLQHFADLFYDPQGGYIMMSESK